MQARNETKASFISLQKKKIYLDSYGEVAKSQILFFLSSQIFTT